MFWSDEIVTDDWSVDLMNYSIIHLSISLLKGQILILEIVFRGLSDILYIGFR